MKKGGGIIIIIGIIVILILAVVIYFLLRTTKKVNPGSVKRILFIGDSNTNANFSYADQLRQRFPDLIIKKISQDGAKSDWMLQQLNNELMQNKYDIISILCGSNDIYGADRIDIAEANLNAMYSLAHSKGSKVLAITPPNKDFYVDRTDQKQALLYELVDWMKNNKSIDFLIDFHAITNNKAFFSSSDGYLHANANAHSILAQQTAQKLNLT